MSTVHDEPLLAPPPTPGAVASPAPGPAGGGLTCQVCGSVPAAPVTFRHVLGFLIACRWYRSRHVLCSSCGLANARAEQNLTLLTGFIGPLAAVVNVWVLIANWTSMRSLRALAPPRGGARPPLSPGNPVILRNGLLVAIALVGGFTTYAIWREPTPTWAVGSCVAYEGMNAAPTGCRGDHDGRIVSEAEPHERCPATAEEYVTVDGSPLSRYCVDTDL